MAQSPSDRGDRGVALGACGIHHALLEDRDAPAIFTVTRRVPAPWTASSLIATVFVRPATRPVAWRTRPANECSGALAVA